MILAMIGGVKDARLGKPPYLWGAVAVGVWHDLEIMERMLREIVAHRKSFKVEHLTAGTHLKAHSPQQFDQEKISRHVFSDDP